MISQFAPRPVSRRLTNLRPVTGKASQANEKQSNQCFQIGKIHMAKKQYDQALKHYTNATIHNPSNYKALCNMGSIYKQNGKFSEARLCYYKAIYANPNDQIALYNLGNLERISGNDQQAISLYEKVISLKQKLNVNIGALYYDTLINLGICYKNLQMYDEAIKWNEMASQENSKDQSAYFNQSMCLMKKIYGLLKGNFVIVKKKLCQDVKPILEKVLLINPNHFGPKIALIQLKYLENPGQENYNAAIKQFQNLIKLAPEQDKNQVSLKIKYCQNQLKKIETSKIILPPKQDIIQYENIKKQEKPNKYDIKPTNVQNTNPNIAQNPIKAPLQKPQTPSAVIRKPSAPSIPGKQTIQQKKDTRKKIEKLIQQKKFEEAFQLSREMPDGSEKYEIQIIINYLQCIQTENDRFLESAVAIYRDYIYANQQSKPITKDSFSEKGHQVMATMLTVYGEYEQASKHYEILLSMKQDHKFEKSQDKKTEQNKLKQIHAQLGVCYAERGLISQAINEYKKSLEMQPANYFLMTNLCGLLINDNKKPEALGYYEAYLQKNGGDNIPNKVQLVDSLLNISICLRDTPDQEKALQKTIEAIQKHFGDYESKRSNLHQQAILGVYLRQAEILQQKSESVPASSSQKREYYSKLLDSYLTCLQFENCPDRQAICINVGILFYLNGCYVNALNFYKTVVLNKKMIANNIGLTYLHLHQYEKALTCFSYASSENPQNIIYALNLQISKWICGLNETNIVYKYPCQCQIMLENRQALGLWLVDELTNMIDNNELEIEIYDSNEKFSEQVQKLIRKILEKSENKKGLSENDKNKLTVIEDVFQKHNKKWHKSGEQLKLSQKPVSAQILSLALKKCSDQKQFETSFGSILDILLKMPESPQFLTIVQASLLLLIIKNPHIQKMNQIIRQLISKKKIFNFTQTIQSLQNQQFKNNTQNGLIGKKVQIKDIERDLNYKVLQTTTRDVQCLIENLSEYVMQHVEKTYYSSPSTVLQPLTRSYKIPHCQNADECVRCVISSSQLYTTLFKKKIDYKGEKILKEKSFKTYAQEERKFINKCLQNEQNKVYNKANQTLTVELNKRIMPFVIRTRHKKFSDVKQFISRIDQSFKISEDASEKGVREVQINKSVVLELWWGQNITYVDRFCHWLCSRSTNLYLDALFLMAEEADHYNLE